MPVNLPKKLNATYSHLIYRNKSVHSKAIETEMSLHFRFGFFVGGGGVCGKQFPNYFYRNFFVLMESVSL